MKLILHEFNRFIRLDEAREAYLSINSIRNFLWYDRRGLERQIINKQLIIPIRVNIVARSCAKVDPGFTLIEVQFQGWIHLITFKEKGAMMNIISVNLFTRFFFSFIYRKALESRKNTSTIKFSVRFTVSVQKLYLGINKCK